MEINQSIIIHTHCQLASLVSIAQFWSYPLHLKGNASVRNTTEVTPQVSWWGEATCILLSLAAEQASAAPVLRTPLDTVKIPQLSYPS